MSVFSIFVFGVVGVVVVVVFGVLSSVSMMHSYLWVTGTFLRQIQICIARSEFVHAWRISFGLLGALFVVVFNYNFVLAMAWMLSYIVCHSVAWVLVMLDESPRL